MEKTIQTLTAYIPMEVHFTRLDEEDSLFEGTNFEIADVQTGDMIAHCAFDEQGRLIQYTFIGEYEAGDMISKDVEAISKDFIQAFYPRELDAHTLDSIIDLDDSYMVNYGLKEEQYGIVIPHLGFNTLVSTAGQVIQFSFAGEPYDINYPEQILSAEEAKERYVSKLDFELIIRLTDSEIYVNGDNTYRLVYRVLESAMDVPAAGEESMTVMEKNEIEPIPYQSSTSQTIYNMIGITDQYQKLGDSVQDGDVIELWATDALTPPAEIDYRDEYVDQMIRIVFAKESGELKFVHNGEYFDEREMMNPYPDDILKQRALDFMFTLFPKADEQFYLEVNEEIDEDPEEYDDEEEFDNDLIEEDFDEEWMLDEEFSENEGIAEESQAYYFQFVINGIPVDEKVTCIQVGIYTGNITGAFIDVPRNEIDMETEPSISKEEAKQLYAQDLEMELTFASEYDEDGNQQFVLTYLPSFPKTVGHVQLIDARNGKAYFVDVGDSVFY